MSNTSRRDFLKVSAAGAAATALNATHTSALAAESQDSGGFTPNFQPAPGQKYDLLIKGGEILDPSQGLRGRRDIAIHTGHIAAVEMDIPADRAQQLLSASGHLVLPGLVDLHSHVFPLASGLGLPADELVPQSATATYVSAGDAGANNFGGFRHWVISQARSRIFCLRPHCQYRPGRFSGGRDVQHRLCHCRAGRQDGSGKRRRCARDQSPRESQRCWR